jgi:ubiquinone/menaquinone biosynthesis C-methylase UbiE
MASATVRNYFVTQTKANSVQADWRMLCVERGHLYAELIEKYVGSLRGKRVLDIAAGWGAHAIAFAERGAEVVASDLYDSEFSALERFASDHGLNISTAVADCVSVPQPAGSFDVILALELIEHIPDPKALAREIRRLLKPGGVCFLTTPAKLRSALSREPHYNLPLIALLPFRFQNFIATKLFGRTYPFSITRQYLSTAGIAKDFPGFACQPVLYWAAEKITKRVPFLRPLIERYFWKAVILRSV